MPEDSFTQLVQAIMANIYQGGGVYSRCKRYEKTRWPPINDKAHNYFILTENPIILVKSMVYTENIPITLNHHGNKPFRDEGGGEGKIIQV